MESFDTTLVTIGALLLLGVIAYGVSRRIALPQVTILILLGALVGPGGLDLLPDQTKAWFPLVSTLALLFVGFLLGGRLAWDKLRAHGKAILGVSVTHVAGVTVFVFLGLWAIGVPFEIALLLGGIGAAAAPAAIQSVALEMRARGPFTDTMLGVVAIDDAWGLIVFSVLLAIVGTGGAAATGHALVSGGWEVGGALAAGLLLGIPSALVVRHLRGDDPMQAEAIGMIFLCGGIALWMEVSFLLCVMMMGAVVANMAKDGGRPFEVVEHFE